MKERYDVVDVVIVGAGIAGAIIASQLAQQKKRVLVLEAGAGAGATWDGYSQYVENFYTASAKTPNSPYPPNPNAAAQDVIDVSRIVNGQPNTDGYFVQLGPIPFLSDYVRTQGGTTLHWLGTTLRMLPRDFRLYRDFGIGVDWPLGYEDLVPYYELAEEEIGVSASIEDQRELEKLLGYRAGRLFRKNYHFPMQKIPQSYLDTTFERDLGDLAVDLSGRRQDVKIVSTPQGRNSMPNPEYVSPSTGSKGYLVKGAVDHPYNGLRCEGNAACVPICPVQAKYNALKTLQKAGTHYCTLIVQAVASNIELDPDSGRVTGIVYKKYNTPQSNEFTYHTARGKIYVIAAHAVESAKLLLASGAARTSGQAGRNLMDHPTLITWGLMPENIGAYRGPSSTSNIASFRDGNFRKHHSAFIVPLDNWGWLWPEFSPGTDVTKAIDKHSLFGPRLRRHLADTVTRQFNLQFEFEQLPDPSNRVTIDPQYKDALGNYRPVVRYDIADYTREAMMVARSIATGIFARVGASDHTRFRPTEAGYLEYKGVGYTVRGAGHLVGTHRIGASRNNSVTNRYSRAWDHENLYVVGPGSMPTIGTSNPTLTVAALAFMAARNIQKELG
ncbi:MAG: GMC family oxidoreductase [Acidobacteria bacterium]|nr:GMC family oxidoreductase [Acidobacteriota bacterium]